jgi:hypothetical protein
MAKTGKLAPYMGTYKGYPVYFKIDTFGNKDLNLKLEKELFYKVNRGSLWERIIKILK